MLVLVREEIQNENEEEIKKKIGSSNSDRAWLRLLCLILLKEHWLKQKQ